MGNSGKGRSRTLGSRIWILGIVYFLDHSRKLPTFYVFVDRDSKRVLVTEVIGSGTHWSYLKVQASDEK